MTYESYIKAKLVIFVVDEAYHLGGTEPMLAVAQVLANRVNAGWFGGNWRQVIDGAVEVAATQYDGHATIDEREGSFRELLRRIDDVYHGTADDQNVNNEQGQRSLYYADLLQVNRAWFRESVLDDLGNHPRLATVGGLTFFG